MSSAPTLLVDARAAFGSGLGRYMREIVRAMCASARSDFREIVLAGDPDELAPFVESLSSAHSAPNAMRGGASPRALRGTPVRVVPLPLPRYAWQLPFRWDDAAAAVGAPHVAWFPHWDGAWTAPRSVTTLHDLIALESDGGFIVRAAAKRAVAQAWIGRMVQGSAALITGAEGAAARIRAEFPTATNKLHVVPHGVAEVFFAAGRRDGNAPSASAAVSPRAPYLLTVANKKPHKNLAMAIRAFAQLAREQPTLRLVMVGERFPHAAELRTLAASLGVAERVDDVMGISDEALAALYAGAEALLVCSREEGFGMVALEGMACGTPVIAVDRAPLPEVLGDAGVIVRFDDDRAMAGAVTRLQADAAHRAERIAAGRARAAGFTWARAAERTSQILLAV